MSRTSPAMQEKKSVFVLVFCVFFRFVFWLFLFLVFLCLCGLAFQFLSVCVFVFCERLGVPFETYPFMIHYK